MAWTADFVVGCEDLTFLFSARQAVRWNRDAQEAALDLEIVNTLLQLGEPMRQITMVVEDHWVVPFYIVKDLGRE